MYGMMGFPTEAWWCARHWRRVGILKCCNHHHPTPSATNSSDSPSFSRSFSLSLLTYPTHAGQSIIIHRIDDALRAVKTNEKKTPNPTRPKHKHTDRETDPSPSALGAYNTQKRVDVCCLKMFKAYSRVMTLCCAGEEFADLMCLTPPRGPKMRHHHRSLSPRA